MSSASPSEPTETAEASAKPLGIAETIEVLARLGAAAESSVLIGGQALNFWAKQYLQRAPTLRAEGPFASKDIDLCGTQEEVRLCARALGGRAVYQSSDARSLCIGIVHYYDSGNEERQLDFLSKPFGLEAEPVFEMSLPVTLKSRDGIEATIRVMHPFHSFMSRVANVGGLEKYQTDHGVRQMKASILCLRSFLEDQLDAGEDKAVKKLNERVFKFSLESSDAQKVFELYRIEPFDAVLHDDKRLPAMFGAKRYPQMVHELKQRRGHAKALTAPKQAERQPESPPSAAGTAEFVLVSKHLRGSKYVATLRADDGLRVEIPDYRPGREEPRTGDRVRISPDGCKLELVSRGRDHDRGR